MCAKCDILTYEEVLEIIRQIEVDEYPHLEDANHGRNSHHAFPKTAAPVIVPRFDTGLDIGTDALDSLAACELVWGFEQEWKPGVVFNTRIESADKPMWRDSMAHRRCVLPVASFFETSKEGRAISRNTGNQTRQQYEFTVTDQQVALIGCVWHKDRFSMVTTQANKDMAPVHDRMPLILRVEELPLWFGPRFLELADRSSMSLNLHALES